MMLLVSFGYAQNTLVEARPEIGWDSLKSLIVYPEIARRAGVEDIARVNIQIDALGKVVSVDFGGSGMFSNSVKSTLRKVTWIPETYDGKKRSSQVVFDVQFQLKESKNFPKHRVLLIESSNPAVR